MPPLPCHRPSWSGARASLCSRGAVGSIPTGQGLTCAHRTPLSSVPKIEGPRCCHRTLLLLIPQARHLSMWEPVVPHPQSPRTHRSSGSPVVPHPTGEGLAYADGTLLTPILTASVDAWPSRAHECPQVPKSFVL